MLATPARRLLVALAVVLAPLGLAPAAGATDVAPGALGDWKLDLRNNASARFVAGPGGAGALGSGSLRLATGSSLAANNTVNSSLMRGGKAHAALVDMVGERMADLTTLTYKAYVDPASNALGTGFQVGLNVPIDKDGDGAWDSTLVYEPYYITSTAITRGQWITYDALAEQGAWWSTNERTCNGSSDMGTSHCYRSMSWWVAKWASQGHSPTILDSTVENPLTAKPSGQQPVAGGISFLVGQRGGPSNWDNVTAYLDDVNVAVGAGPAKAYDFELPLAESAPVRPEAPAGWSFEDRNTAAHAFVSTPAGGLGDGALEMTTGPGALVAGGPGGVYGVGGKSYASFAGLAGRRVDELTDLSFSVYNESPPAGVGISVNVPVDLEGDGDFDTMLVYEPSHQASDNTLLQGQWQEWDARSAKGGWWATPHVVTPNCPTFQCNKTLEDQLGPYFHSAVIFGAGAETSGQPFPAGVSFVVGQRSGGTWNNYVGYLDDVRIGLLGAIDDYDFERSTISSEVVAEPGEPVTVDTPGGGTTADPIGVQIDVPANTGGGTVSIDEMPKGDGAIDDGQIPDEDGQYGLLDKVVHIEAPDAPDAASPLTFTFNVFAPGLPVEQVKVFRNGGVLSPCASVTLSFAGTIACVQSVTALAGGQLAIVVKTLQASFWAVGAPDPVVVFDAPTEATSDSTPTFAYHAEMDGVTVPADFRCEAAPHADAGCGTATTAGSYTTPDLGGDGAKSLAVQANVGGVGGPINTHAFYLDTVAPGTSITSGPIAPKTKVTSASFDYTATGTGAGDETLTYWCTLDGGTATLCGDTTPANQHYGGPLADGPHTFTVAARDAAGNQDATPATYTWTVDTSMPVVTINWPRDGGWYSVDKDVATHWTCTDNGTVTTSAPVALGAAIPRGSLGNKTFTVSCTDDANNTTTVTHGYAIKTFADIVKRNPLSAYFRLGEAAGTPQVSDASGSGRHGEYKNATAWEEFGISGDGNAARRFVGEGGYVYANGIEAPKNALTLGGWVRFSDLEDASVLDHGYDAGIYVKNRKLVFRMLGASVTDTADIAVNTWYFVAGTWDGATMRLWKTSGAPGITTLPTSVGTPVTMARNPSGYSTFYIGYGQDAPWLRGVMDEVFYYPTALSQHRLNELWLADPPAEPRAAAQQQQQQPAATVGAGSTNATSGGSPTVAAATESVTSSAKARAVTQVGQVTAKLAKAQKALGRLKRQVASRAKVRAAERKVRTLRAELRRAKLRVRGL